ncbi:hypothetical protein ACHAW6_011581 [Cyclotella cf. meneghiniana]
MLSSSDATAARCNRVNVPQSSSNSSAGNDLLSGKNMAASPTYAFLRPRSTKPVPSLHENHERALVGITPTAVGLTNAITPPEEPMHCSRLVGDDQALPSSDNLFSTKSPQFTLFGLGYRSPSKKQKTKDRSAIVFRPGSQETTPSDRSCDLCEGSDDTALYSPATENAMVDSPSITSTNPSSTKDERSFSTPMKDEAMSLSPFTPRCRLMEKLKIQSPGKPGLSSTTPNTMADNKVHALHTLPRVAVSSLSPSLPRVQPEKDVMELKMSTIDSTGKSFDFKYGTPIPSPGAKKRTPDRTPGCSGSSPFVQARIGQIPCIGHQLGSSFKTLPPRDVTPRDNLNNMMNDCTSIVGFSGNKQTSHQKQENPSYFSSSPRVVPLTVLSRNGSPVMNSPSPHSLNGGVMPSPLMRSLDTVAKEDDDEWSALKSEVPLMFNSGPQRFPVIKLSPRKRGNNFDTGHAASIMLDSSHSSSQTQVRRGFFNNLSDCPDSKGDHCAEMDLLSGFEDHVATTAVEPPVHKSHCTNRSRLPSNVNINDSEGEEEEEEVIEFTRRPLLLPDFVDSHRTSCSGCLSFEGLDADAWNKTSINTRKLAHHGQGIPMPSIICRPRDALIRKETPPQKLSYLPRPLPVAQIKSRSLFNTILDPIQSLIEADSIAEASRYNEPLTDDDSDTEGADSFLLCLPHTKDEKRSCHWKNCSSLPPKRNSREGYKSLVLAGEDAVFNPSTSSGQEDSLQSPISDDPWTTSTSTKLECVRPRGLSDSTFITHCSFSDDSGGNAAYARQNPQRSSTFLRSSGMEQSVCSLLSMNSLCGLDIVHESTPSKPDDMLSVLLPSEPYELLRNDEPPTGYLKSLRSEQSLNSLGLSVDSTVDASRDLFTPPITANRSSRMLSPPQLRSRTSVFINTKGIS